MGIATGSSYYSTRFRTQSIQMWPFRKKPTPAPVEDVIQGDDRAWFLTPPPEWSFVIDGVDFHLPGREFDPQAFDWARKALAIIRGLSAEIDQRVLEALDGHPINVGSRNLHSISLDGYAAKGQFNLTYFGDESWGDLGVDVVLADGRIVDVWGSD